MLDLFVIAAESSGDLLGSGLIRNLLDMRPNLKIGAVAGPLMRKLSLKSFFLMEHLQVMGFVDVVISLPKILIYFFLIRRAILKEMPTAVIFIDYPGFNLRLERSLRKKGYSGKLIHVVCPSVWAHGKKRIEQMTATLDLLLVLFPFEKKCFTSTSLKVQYVGHPLASLIPDQGEVSRDKTLALFPGSREAEIRHNLPLQIAAALRLVSSVPSIQLALSVAQDSLRPLIDRLLAPFALQVKISFVYPAQKYELMRRAWVAIATSGTITLELALHSVPTVVNFEVRQIDRFIAQKILHVDLPFYCIVNILLSRSVFPELIGPNCNENQIFFWVEKLWLDRQIRSTILTDCSRVREILGTGNADYKAAESVVALAF